MSITCWDVLNGKKCSKGYFKCKFCQADALTCKQKTPKTAPSKPFQVAPAVAQGQPKTSFNLQQTAPPTSKAKAVVPAKLSIKAAVPAKVSIVPQAGNSASHGHVNQVNPLQAKASAILQAAKSASAGQVNHVKPARVSIVPQAAKSASAGLVTPARVSIIPQAAKAASVGQVNHVPPLLPAKASNIPQAVNSASAGQVNLVTLFNFSEEWSTLDNSAILSKIKQELEAFGTLSVLRMPKPGVAVASFASAETAKEAVTALGTSGFDIPFEIYHGYKWGLLSDDPLSVSASTNPVYYTFIYIDELDMPNRPIVEPAKIDCEVYVDPLPEQKFIGEWLAAFGEVDEIFRIPAQGSFMQPSEKGYVRFKTHEAAKACVDADAGRWSESERALSWQKSTGAKEHCYPDNIVTILIGKRGEDINALASRCGLKSVQVLGMDSYSSSTRLHVKGVGEPAAIPLLRPELEKRLAVIHEQMNAHLHRYKKGIVVHIDELQMVHRPNCDPGPKDREVWVARTPDEAELQEWSSSFGEVEEVFRLPGTENDEIEEKGYVRFCDHSGAKACIQAGIGEWSESERALSWQRLKRNMNKGAHAYPESIVGWLLQNGGEHLKEIAQKCGLLHVKLCGENLRDSGILESKRLHFVAEGGSKTSIEEFRAELELKMNEIHKLLKDALHKRKKTLRWREQRRQKTEEERTEFWTEHLAEDEEEECSLNSDVESIHEVEQDALPPPPPPPARRSVRRFPPQPPDESPPRHLLQQSNDFRNSRHRWGNPYVDDDNAGRGRSRSRRGRSRSREERSGWARFAEQDRQRYGTDWRRESSRSRSRGRWATRRKRF